MIRFTPLLFALLLALVSCSGRGPDVIDPTAGERTETAFMGVGNGADGALLHYSEVVGVVDPNEYLSVNGKELGFTPDGIYHGFDRLYLHNRTAGEIVVLDVETRTELAVIDGFPTGGPSSGLIGMEFSNLSQAWVYAAGVDSLFHVDARNLVQVRPVLMPGSPTTVATINNRVFVGIQREDGSGGLVEFRSNDPEFEVREIYEFPEPPIFVGVNSDSAHVVVLTTGSDAELGNPAFHVFDLIDDRHVFEFNVPIPALTDRLGDQPSFLKLTRDFYLYVANQQGVTRIDTRSWGRITDLFFGRPFSIVEADPFTDLVYAVAEASPATVETVTLQGQARPSIEIGSPVRSITFVPSSRVR